MRMTMKMKMMMLLPNLRPVNLPYVQLRNYSRNVNRCVCRTFIALVAFRASMTQEILISLAPVGMCVSFSSPPGKRNALFAYPEKSSPG